VASIIGAVALFVVVVGVLLPAVAWLDRRTRADALGRVVHGVGSGPGVTARELVAPLSDALAWLRRGEAIPPGAIPVAARIGPGLSFVAALAAFTVIPFGGRYTITAEPFSFVVSDPEWGLLLLVIAPLAAGLGLAIAGLAGTRLESQLGGLRTASQTLAGALALAAALLPMWVAYGSLRPIAVGLAQDRVLSLAALLERVGVASPAWLPGWVGLPAWGIVLNPLAFALFFVAAMVLGGRPPFDAPSAGLAGGRPGGLGGEWSGARRVLAGGAAHLWTLVFAGAAVAVFLGGWTIPWLPQQTIVGLVSPLFGDGFAHLVCLALHVAAFLAKLSLVVGTTLRVRLRIPRWRTDQVVALCGRTLVPLALLDTALAAWVVAGWRVAA
jgi:NADH-quinone oxidoreductase subunit H